MTCSVMNDCAPLCQVQVSVPPSQNIHSPSFHCRYPARKKWIFRRDLSPEKSIMNSLPRDNSWLPDRWMNIGYNGQLELDRKRVSSSSSCSSSMIYEWGPIRVGIRITRIMRESFLGTERKQLQGFWDQNEDESLCRIGGPPKAKRDKMGFFSLSLNSCSLKSSSPAFRDATINDGDGSCPKSHSILLLLCFVLRLSETRFEMNCCLTSLSGVEISP